MNKTIFNFIHRFLFKVRSLFVNTIISAIKYNDMNFISYLQKDAHKKTIEILGDEISNSLFFESKHDLWDFTVENICEKKKESSKKVCMEFGVGGGESITYFAKKFQSKKF